MRVGRVPNPPLVIADFRRVRPGGEARPSRRLADLVESSQSRRLDFALPPAGLLLLFSDVELALQLTARLETRDLPSRGETNAHRELKRLAVSWALAHRLALCGMEVRLPRSGYRADVAAAMPRVLSPAACTAVFECKASRADFRRDAAPETATAAEVGELRSRLRSLREAIGAHRPDLRRGEELFPVFDALDLRGVRHATHARLTRQLRAAEVRLAEGTKFAKLARWRSASLLYLVTEPDVAAPADVPDGWGWLERAGQALLLRARPCLHETTPDERVALVERIAAVASSGTRRTLGIAWSREPCPES